MEIEYEPRWRDDRTERLVDILFQNLSYDKVGYLLARQQEIFPAYEVFLENRHQKLVLAVSNQVSRLTEKWQETSLDLAFWLDFAQIMQNLADISHQNAAFVRVYHEVIDQINLG